MNLDVLENDIPKESRWVVEYERKKMDEIAAKNLNDDIKAVSYTHLDAIASYNKQMGGTML